MNEFKSIDIKEVENPKNDIRDVKVNTDKMLFDEAKDFLKAEVSGSSEFGGKFNSYEDRLNCTPKEGEKGKWNGDRGESVFVPNTETHEGIVVKRILDEKGLEGVRYVNCEPDFSPFSKGTVQIEGMSDDRIRNNYPKADIKLAEKWNEEKKNGRTGWTPRDVANYRHDNGLSWHERCDTKTMDLVPYHINDYFKHSGGVSECKVRDGGRLGGDFDE